MAGTQENNARALLAALPTVPLLLPDGERNTFYNDAPTWLRGHFVHTNLFHEVYHHAQYNMSRENQEDGPIVGRFAGALFEAYGLFLISHKYNQPGYSLAYGDTVLDIYHSAYPNAEVVYHPYRKSLKGVSVPDALLVAHDTREGSVIQYVCEFTTTDQNKRGNFYSGPRRGHLSKSAEFFSGTRRDEATLALFAPSASLLYVVPNGFTIKDADLYQEVDILHTPINSIQWREFITYVLEEYVPEGGQLTLAQVLGIHREIPPSQDTWGASVVVTRLVQADELPVDELLAGVNPDEEWEKIRTKYA